MPSNKIERIMYYFVQTVAGILPLPLILSFCMPVIVIWYNNLTQKTL